MGFFYKSIPSSCGCCLLLVSSLMSSLLLVSYNCTFFIFLWISSGFWVSSSPTLLVSSNASPFMVDLALFWVSSLSTPNFRCGFSYVPVSYTHLLNKYFKTLWTYESSSKVAPILVAVLHLAYIPIIMTVNLCFWLINSSRM